MSLQVLVAFGFGIVFAVVMLVLAVKFPRPTPFQYNVFRIVLSLAAAGIAAMVPGFINLDYSSPVGLVIGAGGALAVFVIVFFFNPAQLAIQDSGFPEGSVPPPPDRLPNGAPFPDDQRNAYINVWQSLVSLELAGRALWRDITVQSLSNFADGLQDAEIQVGNHALFFSDDDYENIRGMLEAADFYLSGKVRLGDIDSDSIPNFGVNREIRQQIRQNREWLTRYQNLLGKLRTSLHEQVAA